MLTRKIALFIAAPVFTFLIGCGPKNPLIGVWETDPIMGISSSIEFKSNSMIAGNGMVSQEGKVSEYKIEKEKVGVVVEQNGNKATVWFHITDDDNIEQDLGFSKLRFHRKK